MTKTLHVLCGILLLWLTACTQTKVDYRVEEGNPPTVVELAKGTKSWDGALLPQYPGGQPQVKILHITIPAGTRLPLHYHPVINAGVLLEGQLTVISKTGQRLALKAGDPIIELVNTPHYGINEGDTPAVIIVFYAGIEDTPITKPAP